MSLLLNLSDDARAVIAGLVADSHEVNTDGIFARHEVWQEIREAFPVSDFFHWANVCSNGSRYDSEAGM